MIRLRPQLKMAALNRPVDKASDRLQEYFHQTDLRTKKTMDKLLNLYRENNIDSSAFHGVNGYGCGDLGREKFDSIVASLMGAEAALVRIQLFSGTHAISTALFGALRPGQTILGVSGPPYDTLEEVLGLRNSSSTHTNKGSLADWGIKYKQTELLTGADACAASSRNVAFDLEAIDAQLAADPTIKLLHVQRSTTFDAILSSRCQK